jgi:ABC-type multidrug transport system fused ATPase/permease subunit
LPWLILIQAEADLFHLWHGRRAMLRIRSQLMAAIYDKALKRKDFSGVIRKQGAEVSDDQKDQQGVGKDKDAKDEKSSADVGRIVQLMSGDAYQIGNIVSGAYFLYGAPLEVIVASVYLYKLLGWSAFSGFSVILVCWPINTLLANRAIRIQKGVLAARDKRMGVLNELIGAVKFIKFFAWENRWIARALDSRNVELDWLIKMRINGILFSAVWTLAPVLVSVFSFFVYVYLGNRLTVSVAFTAISLFTMIRSPLGIIPTWMYVFCCICL